MKRIAVILPLLALLTAGYFALDLATNRDALWKVVNGLCVPHQHAGHDPQPCAEVNERDGYAVLKDRRGRTQYLLIPTARITGIEDAAVLASGAPDYWENAWQARRYVERELGAPQPRGIISLAVNSVSGRTQDQLHIHIDCVRAGVQHWIEAHGGDLTDKWQALPQDFSRHPYQMRRVMGSDFPADPFRLLAASVPDQSKMGDETLVAVAEDFADGPGFVLLADRADPLMYDKASGEQLQDHSCALAR